MTRSLRSETAAILQRVRNSGHVVLALDFDVTLAPITDRPEQANLLPEIAVALGELSGSPRISLVILSGRSLTDLRSRVGLNCIHVGNHGLEISGDNLSFTHEGARRLRPAIECACVDLGIALAGVSGVLIEDKELTATVHYRLAPLDLVGWIEATIHLVMRPYASRLLLRPARKAWEIRPRVDWDKGEALRFVLRQIGGKNQLLICAGDDLTDGDLFQVSPNSVSIQVDGRSSTKAGYYSNGPTELASFLGEFAESVKKSPDFIAFLPTSHVFPGYRNTATLQHNAKQRD